MARAIWSGSIAFGLVNVPVKLYPATRSHDIRFHEFKEGTKQRIRHKRVAEASNREVDFEDIAKGYEVSKGTFVQLTQEELASVEPTRNHTIEIEDFVALEEIEPIFFDASYFVVPADQDAARRPYLLLHAALAEQEKVGIGRFVMRTKEHLVAIRPIDRVLCCETLYFADEIVPVSQLENVPKAQKVDRRELDVAEQLVDAQTVDWDPKRYQDTYRDRVMALIQAKAKGEEIEVPEPEEPEEVGDLMEALRRSVESLKASKGGRSSSKRTTSSKRASASKRATSSKRATRQRKAS